MGEHSTPRKDGTISNVIVYDEKELNPKCIWRVPHGKTQPFIYKVSVLLVKEFFQWIIQLWIFLGC